MGDSSVQHFQEFACYLIIIINVQNAIQNHRCPSLAQNQQNNKYLNAEQKSIETICTTVNVQTKFRYFGWLKKS